MDVVKDPLAQYPVTSLIVGLGLAFLVGVVAYFFARMLMSGVARSADARPPLITAMSLLGILGTIALIGALFTTQESAYTIAATVVGGLTGYLTAQAQQNKMDGDTGIKSNKELSPEITPAVVAEVIPVTEFDDSEEEPPVEDAVDNDEDSEEEEINEPPRP